MAGSQSIETAGLCSNCSKPVKKKVGNIDSQIIEQNIEVSILKKSSDCYKLRSPLLTANQITRLIRHPKSSFQRLYHHICHRHIMPFRLCRPVRFLRYLRSSTPPSTHNLLPDSTAHSSTNFSANAANTIGKSREPFTTLITSIPP
jgi:hypothetical protein